MELLGKMSQKERYDFFGKYYDTVKKMYDEGDISERDWTCFRVASSGAIKKDISNESNISFSMVQEVLENIIEKAESNMKDAEILAKDDKTNIDRNMLNTILLFMLPEEKERILKDITFVQRPSIYARIGSAYAKRHRADGLHEKLIARLEVKLCEVNLLEMMIKQYLPPEDNFDAEFDGDTPF